MKYLKTYNESLDFFPVATDEDILEKLLKLSPDEILTQSIRYNILKGFEYLIYNNLVDDNTKYLLEKYKLGLQQHQLKDYEKWFLKKLKNLTIYKSQIHDDTSIYKENDVALFKYNRKECILHYSYPKIRIVFITKFNLNLIQSNILVKGMVEEHLKIKIDIINVSGED